MKNDNWANIAQNVENKIKLKASKFKYNEETEEKE